MSAAIQSPRDILQRAALRTLATSHDRADAHLDLAADLPGDGDDRIGDAPRSRSSAARSSSTRLLDPAIDSTQPIGAARIGRAEPSSGSGMPPRRRSAPGMSVIGSRSPVAFSAGTVRRRPVKIAL